MDLHQKIALPFLKDKTLHAFVVLEPFNSMLSQMAPENANQKMGILKHKVQFQMFVPYSNSPVTHTLASPLADVWLPLHMPNTIIAKHARVLITYT